MRGGRGKTQGPVAPAKVASNSSQVGKMGWFVRKENLVVRFRRRGTKREEDSDWTEEAKGNFN
jgi:hypothetical protein